MKKVTIVLAFLVTCHLVKAQAQFGVHANGIVASQSMKASGIKITSDGRFSWKAGLIANVPATDEISFMPQLNLVNKGSKFNFDGLKTETKATYLELPLNFVYNSNGFFGGVGPVLSYGMSGKEKMTDGTDTQEVKIKFDGKEDGTDDFSHYKAFEFGGNLIAGYKLESGLFFNVHYNFGLSNIAPTSQGNAMPMSQATAKNSYFGFGIGYFFNGGGSASK